MDIDATEPRDVKQRRPKDLGRRNRHNDIWRFGPELLYELRVIDRSG
jgi:hypothetical protein